MCILFLSYDPSLSSRYMLIAANNRDELFIRPTSPAHFWPDQPHILAGRDLQYGSSSGGTWLGVSSRGRFAVLTNYRTHPDCIRPDAHSRGYLVSEFLSGEQTPVNYCESVLSQGDFYNGFSLITADLSRKEIVYCSNRSSTQTCQHLDAGSVYGLSNGLLDSPWMKVIEGKKHFSDIVANISADVSNEKLTEQLFTLLSDDRCLHPDPSIPDTGYSEQRLKTTSSIFVNPVLLPGGTYGTRTSSVLLVGREGEVTFTERTLSEPTDSSSSQWDSRTFHFSIPIS